MDREAWSDAVMGSQRVGHDWATELNWTELTRWTFVGKIMSLIFNMLSRLAITFLPRSKCLLISLPSANDSAIETQICMTCMTDLYDLFQISILFSSKFLSIFSALSYIKGRPNLPLMWLNDLGFTLLFKLFLKYFKQVRININTLYLAMSFSEC